MQTKWTDYWYLWSNDRLTNGLRQIFEPARLARWPRPLSLGVRRAAGCINLSTENWPHAYDPVPSRWLVPNGFTSHRSEDVLRAFSFGSELGSRPWTKSVADDHCHQHVDRGFKGRLLGGRRIAHIAPAVRGSRCCGGAGALAFPLEAASGHTNGQEPTRGLQRRCHRDHHYDHGAGAEDSAW